MKFEDALKCMREGKKVTIKGYDVFYFVFNDKIYDVAFDKENATFDESELLAEDWEVVDD